MTSQPLGEVGRMSRCVCSSRMLQSYLDGELDSPSVVEQVGEHLEECRRCGLSAATYRAIKQALRSRSRDIDELALRRLHGFTRSLTRCGGGPEETGRTPQDSPGPASTQRIGEARGATQAVSRPVRKPGGQGVGN